LGQHLIDYKIRFERTVVGSQSCEAVVSAASENEAVEKFRAGDFKRFLVRDNTNTTFYPNDEEFEITVLES